MKKNVISFLLIGFLSLSAQNQRVDTLHSFVNNEVIFRLFHVNCNFVDIKIERNKIGLPIRNHIRKIDGLDLGRRSIENDAFLGELVDTVYLPGKYEYVESYILTNNEGVRITGKKFFYSTFDYPKLASPDIRNERDTLFLGENFGFSIAATGYNNLDAYMYVVKLGDKDVDSVKGSTSVYLSKYLESKENAGKKLEVVAYYNNRPYKYYGNKNELQSSEWTFTIIKPTAEWLDQSVGFGQHLIVVDRPTNAATNTFDLYFTLFYYGMDGNKKILCNPDIINVDEDQNKYQVSSENLPLSSRVALSIDLDKIPKEEETDLSFGFTATTKFGTTDFKSKPGLKIFIR